MLFFFFKQKTAYEMRISDWSSDVCSSDLAQPRAARLLARRQLLLVSLQRQPAEIPDDPGTAAGAVARGPPQSGAGGGLGRDRRGSGQVEALQVDPRPGRFRPGELRSDEHTSELQSLMRISYAVFYLKTKIKLI